MSHHGAVGWGGYNTSVGATCLVRRVRWVPGELSSVLLPLAWGSKHQVTVAAVGLGTPTPPCLYLPQPISHGAAEQGFPWRVLGQGCSTPWKDVFWLEKQVMR